MDAIAAELGDGAPERVWAAYRRASVIACPVRGEFGSPLGTLLVASLDEAEGSASSCRWSRRSPTSRRSRSSAPSLLEAEGPPRARRAQAEARRRGDLRVARPGRGVRPGGEHAAAVTGATQRAADAPERARRRGAHRRHGGLPEELAAQLVVAGQRRLRARWRAPAPPLLRSGDEAAPLGSVMHAPIELGPRLYGVLTVGHEDPEPLRRGRPRAARQAGALLRGGDRERDRLPARAPHRARADARLRARVAPGAARLRDRPAVRAGGRRGDRRRRVRRLARVATATRWRC